MTHTTSSSRYPLTLTLLGCVMMWHCACKPQAPLESAIPEAPTKIQPPPAPVPSTTPEGRPIATFDHAAITQWSKSANLPVPDNLSTLEPIVAKSLYDALAKAATDPTSNNLATLAKIYESLEFHTSAAELFTRAETSDPDDFRLPYYLGCILQLNGQTDAAIQKLTRSLTLNPNYPLTHARLGQLHINANQLDQARTHLTRYTQLAPDDWLGYVGLGRIAYIQQRYNDALQSLTRAVTLGPSDFQAHYHLGRTLNALGKTADAQHHLNLAASLPKGMWFHHRDPLMLELDRATGSVKNLIDEFERLLPTADWPRLTKLAATIIQRRPDDIIMLGNLASLYRKQNRLDDADRILKRATQLAPENLRLQIINAEILLTRKQYDHARDAANAILLDHPDDPAANNVLARAAYMLKNYAIAESAMRIAINTDPDDTSKQLVFAEILLQRRKLQEAADLYRTILAKHPDNTRAQQRIKQLTPILNPDSEP